MVAFFKKISEAMLSYFKQIKANFKWKHYMNYLCEIILIKRSESNYAVNSVDKFGA